MTRQPRTEEVTPRHGGDGAQGHPRLARLQPGPHRKDTVMIAVSFTLILALLVGYYITSGPTVEVEK